MQSFWLNKHLPNTLIFGLSISVLSALIFVIGLSTPIVDQYLMYQRVAIQQGDIWQLITGNYLHSNHWHLLMNLAGLWVILLLHDLHYSNKGLVLLFCLLSLLEGLSLYVFYPQLFNYVGLSGVLHGLIAFGAVLDITKKIQFGWLLLAGIIAKVGYEQIYGASADVAAIIDASVATESHLIGMILGFLAALGFLAFKPLKK
ncbi:MAG: rhombosortase [Parashewanella sp.]